MNWPTVAAIATELIRAGRLQMAIWTLLSFTTYLRPTEMMRLRRKHIIPPIHGISSHWSVLVADAELNEVTKTGGSDESVVLDSKLTKFLDSPLNHLKAGPQESPLWDFEYPELIKQFKQAAGKVGVPKRTPYQLRHSGPSWDRLHKLRSLEEVKRRGKWKQMLSVMRYEKHATLTSEFQKLTASMRLHHLRCADQLVACVLGRKGLPAPPHL